MGNLSTRAAVEQVDKNQIRLAIFFLYQLAEVKIYPDVTEI